MAGIQSASDTCQCSSHLCVTPRSVTAEIPAAWQQQWRDLSALETRFHLPDVNPFVARDFALISPDVTHTPHPRLAVSSEHGELYYRRDCKFCLPRAYVCLRLCSDLPPQSALQ